MICSFFGNYSNNLNFLKSVCLSSIVKLENWILFHRNYLDQSLNMILNNGSKAWELFLSPLLQPFKHRLSMNYFHKLATTQKRPVSSTNLFLIVCLTYMRRKRIGKYLFIFTQLQTVFHSVNAISFLFLVCIAHHKCVSMKTHDPSLSGLTWN